MVHAGEGVAHREADDLAVPGDLAKLLVDGFNDMARPARDADHRRGLSEDVAELRVLELGPRLGELFAEQLARAFLHAAALRDVAPDFHDLNDRAGRAANG